MKTIEINGFKFKFKVYMLKNFNPISVNEYLLKYYANYSKRMQWKVINNQFTIK